VQDKHFVYTLSDPREPDAIRYVGFTNDPEARLHAHLWDARRGKTWKANWLRRLIGCGIAPTMSLIAEAETRDEVARLEIAAIATYRQAGHRLTNGTIGGDGSAHWTELMRLERSEINRRRWLDKKNRERQRQAMRSFWASSDGATMKARIARKTRVAQTGRKYSLESRAKMRAAKLGKPQMARTPEWKEKIAAAQRGKPRKPWTAEERTRRMASINHDKMSASAKARRRREATQRVVDLIQTTERLTCV
jgi:hypothetical protein